MADRALQADNTGTYRGDCALPPDLQAQLQALPQLVPLQEQHAVLASVIEQDIIPRLLLARGSERAASAAALDIATKLAERVGEFSELVVNHDPAASVAYFEKLRDQGASIETLFADLLAPTARRLGELWTEDINDFYDVARGIGHLQHIVRTFGQEFSDENIHPVTNRRALIMPLPGEQHTFGISLLREHLLRDGWRVWCGPCASMGDVVKLVKSQWFDTVGLSASAIADPEKLAAEIRKIRAASTNKAVHVMVGGYAFNMEPDLVARVGADATAVDARQAVTEAASGRR